MVDLDGTLCKSMHPNEFTDEFGTVDWQSWMSSNAYAPVNEWCRDIINGAVVMGTKVVFLTARTGDEHGRKVTDDWLKNNGFSGYDLVMRAENDFRKDDVIKLEVYIQKIAPIYDVIFAVDDKRNVVDMWRAVGVVGLHCADY